MVRLKFYACGGQRAAEAAFACANIMWVEDKMCYVNLIA
jgi:hypothetical protein